MKTYTRFLLTASILAIAGQSAWASQMECKLTDANKRVCAEIMHSAELINTQQPTTTVDKLKKEAQLCPLSHRAQLRPLLYDLLVEFPLELIDIIIGYDNHLLTGKLQYTMNPTTPCTASIVALSQSKYPNIFHAQTETGKKYLCNAATCFTYGGSREQRGENVPFLGTPRLIRSKAIIHQSIKLPDGSIARADGNEITVISPKIDNRSTVICSFKSGLVTKLLALSDGRLVTGMPNGQIKLWV